MKRMARDLLKRLGSEKSEMLGWRDMWAMVTRKGEKSYGESFSKSAGFNSWGSPIALKVEVPLVSVEGTVLTAAVIQTFYMVSFPNNNIDILL